MSSINRRSFLAACAGSLGLALSACGGSAPADSASKAESQDYKLVKPGTLIFVSELEFPPLDSFEDGVPKGFDVDLSHEIAERMGLKCEYLPPQNFDSIIPMIKQGGKADVGNSAFSVTEERKAEIDFSDPYLDSNLGIAVRNDSDARDENTLNAEDKKIAVQAGSTGEAWVRENLPQATVVPIDSVTSCMTGVEAGQYAAFCGDLPVVAYLSNSFPNCEIAKEIPTGEQYALVISKNNPALTAAINEVLADLRSDGTIDELEEKWFGRVL